MKHDPLPVALRAEIEKSLSKMSLDNVSPYHLSFSSTCQHHTFPSPPLYTNIILLAVLVLIFFFMCATHIYCVHDLSLLLVYAFILLYLFASQGKKPRETLKSHGLEICRFMYWDSALDQNPYKLTWNFLLCLVSLCSYNGWKQCLIYT